jgi:hypothetical protein
MGEQPDRWDGRSDHDRLIDALGDIRRMEKDLLEHKEKLDSLMEGKAKLVGICAGVSGTVAIIVKLFWPAHI